MKHVITTLDEQDKYVLLQIRRQLSEKEAVAALLKMVSGLEQEVGMLKSERDELKFLLEKGRAEHKAKLERIKEQNNHSKAIQKMQDVIYKLSKENESLKNKKAPEMV